MVIAGTGIGYILSSRLGKQAETIDYTIRFIHFLKTGIRYAAQPLEELLGQGAVQYPELPQLSVCHEYMRGGLPFMTAWDTSAEWLSREKRPTARYTQLLSEFGQGVGVSDLEGQLAHCELYLARFDELLAAARAEYAKKGKLYLLLGGFAGLAAALLML